MEKWVSYALVSMLFAGFTSVIAKMGLPGIYGELGLTIRTLFVSLLVLGFVVLIIPASDFALINRHNIFG